MNANSEAPRKCETDVAEHESSVQPQDLENVVEDGSKQFFLLNGNLEKLETMSGGEK